MNNDGEYDACTGVLNFTKRSTCYLWRGDYTCCFLRFSTDILFYCIVVVKPRNKALHRNRVCSRRAGDLSG
jgi:hypothetical protein